MRLVLTALALIFAPAALADDRKQVGARYRIKVGSAGIPGLGVTAGHKLRTRYALYQGQERVGEAYLGDFLAVEEPGRYAVVLHGQRLEIDFQIPKTMTRERLLASWKRSRPVELLPAKSTARLNVPAIWVLHPPQISGPHEDGYSIVKRGAKAAIVEGVALVYPPQEILDIDDGALFANTLVHLLPGEYDLLLNGARYPFKLAKRSQLLRLGAFQIKDPKALTGLELAQRDGGPLTKPGAQWLLVPPGHYRFDGRGLSVEPGQAIDLLAPSGGLPGLRKPRLGIRATPQDRKVIVTGFLPGSPAAAAGLKVSDRVLAIDGAPVTHTRGLARALLKKKPGEKARLSIERKGRAKPFDITIAIQDPADKAPKAKSKPF